MGIKKDEDRVLELRRCKRCKGLSTYFLKDGTKVCKSCGFREKLNSEEVKDARWS